MEGAGEKSERKMFFFHFDFFKKKEKKKNSKITHIIFVTYRIIKKAL